MSASMIGADAAVIGGGLAGAVSAITLAQAGCDAVLIRKGYGSTAMSSSCVSTAGLPAWLASHGVPSPEIGISDAFKAFTTLMSGVNFPFVGDAGEGSDYLTTMGTLKRVELVPFNSASGALDDLRGANILIVGMRGLGGFQPAFIKKALSHYLDAQPVIEEAYLTPSFLRRTSNFTQPEIAHQLDDKRSLERFISEVKDLIGKKQFTHLLFPSILGLEESLRVMTQLQWDIEADCFEAIAKIPSTAGIRLQTAVNRALTQAGVRVFHGKVTGCQRANGRITSIDAKDKASGLRIDAKAFILASGSAIGGGVAHSGDVSETIFNLPLKVAGEDSNSLNKSLYLNEDFFAHQPLLKAGVEVDHAFRPVTAGGDPVYDNLWAAGSVIAPTTVKGWSGLGFAVVSGFLAAQSAQRGIA